MRGVRCPQKPAEDIIMFHYKIFTEGKDRLLAIADTSLIGKTLKHGEAYIEISYEFYGREKCEHAQALALAKSATIINAMGNAITELLINNNIADKESVLLIETKDDHNTIMHAQVVVA